MMTLSKEGIDSSNISRDRVYGLMYIDWVFGLFFVPLFLFILSSQVKAQTGGKDIFLKYKCNKCHAIKSQNIEPIVRAEKEEGEEEEEKGKKKITDLSGVGLKRDAG